MFSVTKIARLGKKQASEKFSVAQLTGVRVVGDYHAWDFSVPILGCGDTVPDDYDGDSRYRFKLEDDYTFDAWVEDLRTLLETITLENLVLGSNRGIDLRLRAVAKPSPGRKMKDADKASWLMNNHGDRVMKVLEEHGGKVSPQVWVEMFNELNG